MVVFVEGDDLVMYSVHVPEFGVTPWRSRKVAIEISYNVDIGAFLQ